MMSFIHLLLIVRRMKFAQQCPKKTLLIMHHTYQSLQSPFFSKNMDNVIKDSLSIFRTMHLYCVQSIFKNLRFLYLIGKTAYR